MYFWCICGEKGDLHVLLLHHLEAPLPIVIFFTLILCHMTFSVCSTCELCIFICLFHVPSSFLSQLRFHDPSLWSVPCKPQHFCPVLSTLYLPWKFPNLFKPSSLSTLCLHPNSWTWMKKKHKSWGLALFKIYSHNPKLNYSTIIIVSSFSFPFSPLFPSYLKLPVFLYYFLWMTLFCCQNKYSQQRF